MGASVGPETVCAWVMFVSQTLHTVLGRTYLSISNERDKELVSPKTMGYTKGGHYSLIKSATEKTQDHLKLHVLVNTASEAAD